MTIAQELSRVIRDVPDFPKKGIVFKDITTLLQNPAAFARTVDALYRQYKRERIDAVVCVEARGFIFGAVLAYKLKAGLVVVRKKGKLRLKPTVYLRAGVRLGYSGSAPRCA